MPARESAQLLTVGNSFADNATEYLPAMASAAGRELVIFRANVSGKSFEFHAHHLALAQANQDDPEGSPYKNDPDVLGTSDTDKVSLPMALAARAWDFVTIHQYSPLSYKPESFEPYASQIIAAIREFAPGAEILVHQTWAFREDCPRYRKGFTQQVMFERLRAAYADLAARNGRLRIIPCGAAMQAARATPRWTYRPDPDYDFENPPPGKLPMQDGSLNVGWKWVKDGGNLGHTKLHLDFKHANAAGKYLCACAWFEVLYHLDCNETAAFTPDGLAAEDAADLRRIAREVVDRHGFRVRG